MKSLAVLAFAATLAACSPVKIVNIDKADEFSLTNYKTFDFVDIDVSGVNSPSFNQRVEWIKDEIMKQLVQKGLTQTSASPELLLNIGIVMEEKAQTRETTLMDAPTYMGQRNYHWESQEVVVNHYHEGTVTMDFVDSKTNARVCEAVASSVVFKNESSGKKNIANGVEMVFEKISGL